MDTPESRHQKWLDWCAYLDKLRETLAPCKCGKTGKGLIFRAWRLGQGSSVYCEACGYGAPVDDDARLIEQERGAEGAAERWNATRAADKARGLP